MNDKPVSVAMLGISSYGHYYLATLLKEFAPGSIELRAVISRSAESSKYYQELKKRKVQVFHSLSEFYESGNHAELVVISSPIHYHVPQSCEALTHGSHVLCEKPLGATVQEAEHLIQTRDSSNRWIMIGYQWSYSEAIQALKRDVLNGVFGKPLRLKTLCFWPRDKAYYERNNWAGKIKDEKGSWILDSPANNAMAHFLHNMFYVLGEKVNTSAVPVEVTAELYRAYAIENFDSVAFRALTEKGTELLFYASHTIPKERGPMFCFEFERATVSYGEFSDEIIAKDRRSEEKSYGSPEADHQFRKLFEAVAAVRESRLILCGPEAAHSQTLCVNGIQESVQEIVSFAESMIQEDRKERRRWVRGLAEAFYDSYLKGILPSEASFTWARLGRSVNLRGYKFFPGGIISQSS
ncbi:MAG: Gfo/Idh/MocA family protein [Candidatus Aminicenantaceae bacterium]